MPLFRKRLTTDSPETASGSPAYDARINPANAGAAAAFLDRLQTQTDIHLFGDKSAAARVFSHAYDSQPSPTALAMMGLGQQAQMIRDSMDRRLEPPFAGAYLGPVPALAASPSEPIFHGGFDHLTHHAHTRARTRRNLRGA